MRILLVAAMLTLSTSAALAEEGRPSQILCDSSKIGARELADCLRIAADKSDKELNATFEAAVKSIDARTHLLSSQKARWRRSLNDAEAQWIGWRDSECQDVAPFEAGMGAKGGDPRLACIIDQNTRRAADIKSRYP
jgi:uncharacterized protein YecT (DUF1311 family)